VRTQPRTRCVLGKEAGLGRLRADSEKRDFFNSLLERHGRPCTEVGGRPCVALRTPDRLCNCLGPVRTETRAKARYRTTDRGKAKSSQALVFLAPASSSPSRDQANTQLVCGAVTAQPVENRLARPIRSPPSSWRACLARWSQIIHRYPPLLRKLAGEPVDSHMPVRSP
jgi:hypothetical protein